MRLGIAIALALVAIGFAIVGSSWLDRRPVQRLLFLGHSLTYYNEMPAMVAKMADSADSPIRYEITMRPFPNASLEDHWRSRKSREILFQTDWDRVIVQPERSYQQERQDSGLYRAGSGLLTGTGKGRPAVVISWLPAESGRREHNDATVRSEQFDVVQSNLRGLAYATGADVIDVAGVWEAVLEEELPFSLYKDGNHPSLEGSYLAAPVVYASIGQADVTAVTYVPWGMRSDHAALLRDRVQAALARP